jgi:hypothetical protein
MSRDTDVPNDRDTRAVIRLKVENGETNFDLMTRIVGRGNDTARGELIEMDRKTVSRAREGVVGEEFIANTIVALRRHERLLATCGQTPDFDSLFEIVIVGADREQVAA